MAYTVGDTILDNEYNVFATGGLDGTPNHTIPNVNTIWGSGTGDKGYGQSTTLTSVAAPTEVTATQWATMLDRMDAMEAHQGSAITNPTNPVSGDDIDIFTNLETDMDTLFNNRLNNSANGSDGSNTIVGTNSWTTSATNQARFTFTSSDHLRYFFNAGGEFRMSFARAGGTAHTKNAEWTNLCTDCGTIVFRARTMTKVGGSGTPTIDINDGWYDISASFVIKFKQFEGTTPYSSNFISVEFRQFTNTQLDIRVIYKDDAADDFDDTVDGTLTSTFVTRPPSTAFLTNTWGTPTFATIINVQT